MTFDGTQKIIGRGAQAEVFLYHGFAYKLYKASYPEEWIAFEKHQQGEVNKAGLCPVKYYDTDDGHIIKMDFVDGDTLENKINECVKGNPSDAVPNPLEGFKYLSKAFNFVHSADIQGLEIPHLYDTAAMGMDEEKAQKILPIIKRLSQKMRNCVCHLDMHFLNIMLPNKKSADDAEYKIIDWMNARIAPPVFDYARTYVIFNEFSKDALELYKQIVLPELWASGVSEDDFNSAVEVCAIIREKEKQ